ncbi:MAG: WG repeat-containing protein [Bacteroidia bacterium]|nr:WG repeat-containing protein [Bacteroidia bacterium]
MRQLFLLIALTFSILHGQAQSLRVVKDNIACAYGLKNEAGKWVVPASYPLISTTMEGYFLPKTEQFMGLLAPDGKQILPPEYLSISPAGGRFNILYPDQTGATTPKKINILMVKKGERYGLYHIQKARWIAPIEYYSIQMDGNATFILQGALPEEQYGVITTFVDTTGKIVFPPTRGTILPFGDRPRTLIGNYRDSEGVRGHAGIIDRKGNLICERKYDQLRICGMYGIAAKLEEKTGKIDWDGKELIPPRYFIPPLQYSTESISCLYGDDLIKISENNLWGLMRNDGTVVIEPQYEFLDKVNGWYANLENYGWKVKKNGKHGTVSQKGASVLEARYDTLVRLVTPKKREYWQGYEAAHDHFLGKKDGKYALIAGTGGEITPFQYTAWGAATWGLPNHYFLMDGLKVDAYDLTSLPARPVRSELVADQGKIVLYRIENQLIPFLSKGSGPDRRLCHHPDSIQYQGFGNTLIVHLWPRSYVFNALGKPTFPFEVISFQKNFASIIPLETRSRNQAFMNLASGKVFTDTIYCGFELTKAQLPHLWVLKSAKLKEPEAGKWVMIDTTGKQVLPGAYDQPFLPGDTINSYQNGLIGRMSTRDMKWLIPPRFLKMEWIGAHTLRVTGKDNLEGLYTSDGKELAPPIYESILPLCHFYPFYLNQNNKFDRKGWWQLKKGNTIQLISGTGTLISQPETVTKKLMDLTFEDVPGTEPYDCRFCIMVEMADSLKPNLRKSPQRTALWKLIMEQGNCLPVEKSNNAHGRPNQQTARLDFISDRAFSVAFYTPYNGFDMEMPVPGAGVTVWHNYLLTDKGLVQVSARDFFPDQAAFLREFTRILQSREDIDMGYCAAPEVYLEQVTRDFIFSRDGLMLKLAPSERTFGFYDLLIPWSKLRESEAGRRMADFFQGK